MELSFVNGIVQGVLGPLAAGMAAVMFEGTLDTPTWARAWEIIERYGVTTLFTTPSVVHRLRQGTDGPPAHDIGSLELVVTGGERAVEGDAAWLESLVRPEGPLVVNAWGQTETGGAVLFDPLPRGPGTIPDPGVAIVDGSGRAVPAGTTGEMVLTNPWPGLFVDIEGHADIDGRYRRYRSGNPFSYATGDLAVQHSDGEVEIIRRLDSVVKVSGQLVSLADIAEALGGAPPHRPAVAVRRSTPRGTGSCSVAWSSPTRRHRSRSWPTTSAAMCTNAWAASPGPATSPSSSRSRPTRPRTDLRHALSLVGAGRVKAESFLVSAAQLHEAIAATAVYVTSWSLAGPSTSARPEQCAPRVGGMSSAGLRSKNPTGLRVNPAWSTGMTGQSSGRGKWVGPKVCQMTMSSPSIGRSARVQAGRPAPPGFWLTKSPAG